MKNFNAFLQYCECPKILMHFIIFRKILMHLQYSCIFQYCTTTLRFGCVGDCTFDVPTNQSLKNLDLIPIIFDVANLPHTTQLIRRQVLINLLPKVPLEERHIIVSMLNTNLSVQAENIDANLILEFIVQRI